MLKFRNLLKILHKAIISILCIHTYINVSCLINRIFFFFHLKIHNASKVPILQCFISYKFYKCKIWHRTRQRQIIITERRTTAVAGCFHFHLFFFRNPLLTLVELLLNNVISAYALNTRIFSPRILEFPLFSFFFLELSIK